MADIHILVADDAAGQRLDAYCCGNASCSIISTGVSGFQGKSDKRCFHSRAGELHCL